MMRSRTIVGLGALLVLGCNGLLDEVEQASASASASASTSSSTGTTLGTTNSTSGGPVVDGDGGDSTDSTSTTGQGTDSTGPSTSTTGSTGDMTTGSTGDMTTGSTGDMTTGSTGDMSTGSTGDMSTGSTGDMSTGSTGGPTCDDLYGMAPDYILCVETPTECHFNATTGGGNCNEMCASLMGTCLAAFDNGMACDIIKPNMDDCTTNRTTEICVCDK